MCACVYVCVCECECVCVCVSVFTRRQALSMHPPTPSYRSLCLPASVEARRSNTANVLETAIAPEVIDHSEIGT